MLVEIKKLLHENDIIYEILLGIKIIQVKIILSIFIMVDIKID